MTRRRADRAIHVLQAVHSLEIGGTERVVCDLVRHFNTGPFRTSVCCVDTLGEFGEELRKAGVTVHVLGRRPGIDLQVATRLVRLCRMTGVDLIHAHQYTPYFYAAVACLLAPPRKVVFTEHGRHHPDRLRWRRALSNQILRPVTASYTAVSEFTRDSLVTFERIPRPRIHVIYNGVEPDGASRSSREDARAALGIDASTALVLSIGRLDRVKDFGTLLRAMAKVAIDVPGARLLIAGDGDAVYREELVELANALGIATHVRLLGRRRDIPALLAACDVFALTSMTEATSMTILEAMAACRPVVATDVGGNGELVIPGATGVLVSAGDADAVAHALVDLLTQPDKARGLGFAGGARVIERFARTTAFRAYDAVYRQAVGV